MRKETVSLKLDPDEKSQLSALAASKNRTVHFLMREAISRYVASETAREAFRHEALASWQEHQETGLHVTGDEVLAWLETWGDENEKAPPVCHR